MPEPTDHERPELRLALGMRGGVSLAVWIGGACGEIDELRCDAGFWGTLRRATGYSSVVVDVMAGASAGGLNAVLFGTAIRHGFPMKGLDGVWREVAAVDRLRRRKPPWLSLFDGDGSFLAVLRDELREQLPPAGAEVEEPELIDVQLSATLVEPLEIRAPSPPDEELTRFRSSARFHLRHDPTPGVERRDFEGSPRHLARLALAARATSSFPAAFEPAIVRSSRPGSFGEGAPAADPAGDLVDCRGVFSESRGTARSDDKAVADDFVVADGGIVDNIPLGKALEAVAAAPATGPTRRVVVYLHPDGPSAAAVPDEAQHRQVAPAGRPDPCGRRRVRAVLDGAKAARIQNESIDGDLERLELLNRAARMARATRAATLEGLPADVWDAVVQQWPTYKVLRPGADVAQLRIVLDDPIVALGEDPFPVGGDESRWHAPLCFWTPDQRTDLDGLLTTELRKQLGPAPDAKLLQVGISPLRRTVDLLLEWMRAQKRWGVDTGDRKRELYDVRSVVQVADRCRRHGWVVRAVRGVDGTVADWCTDSLRLLDGLLVSETSAFTDLAAYRASVDGRLQELFLTGTTTPVTGHDVRTGARERLVRIVAAQLAHGGGGSPRPDDPALLLHRVLAEGPMDDSALANRIAALDVVCQAEFLAGRPGAEDLRLVRISAAGDTPVAARFEKLLERTRQIDASLVRKGRPDPWVGRPDFLRPEVKLAGNELSNFSAFLDERWRDNDWLWGRLDAVSGLVEILLGGLGEDGITDELRGLAGVEPGTPLTVRQLRLALTKVRQEEVLAECLEDDPATYTVGLETVVEPGSRAIQRSLGQLTTVGARVLRQEVPRSLRTPVRVAGWVARFVVRRLARPRGRLPAPPE